MRDQARDPPDRARSAGDMHDQPGSAATHADDTGQRAGRPRYLVADSGRDPEYPLLGYEREPACVALTERDGRAGRHARSAAHERIHRLRLPTVSVLG